MFWPKYMNFAKVKILLCELGIPGLAAKPGICNAKLECKQLHVYRMDTVKETFQKFCLKFLQQIQLFEIFLLIPSIKVPSGFHMRIKLKKNRTI